MAMSSPAERVQTRHRREVSTVAKVEYSSRGFERDRDDKHDRSRKEDRRRDRRDDGGEDNRDN